MKRFVVTDAKLCIGCQTCEIACVSAHQDKGQVIDLKSFFPRLKVVRDEDVTGPVMCRQCEDAPCATVCPTGAIVHAKDSVQVDQSKCIGCKTCVLACPYGAMNMVMRAVPRLVGGQQVGVVNKVEAQKCDLCMTRSNGPACVEVCPTKALSVMEPTTLQKLRQDRQKVTLSAMLQVQV